MRIQFNVPVRSTPFLLIICAKAHQQQSKLKFLKFKTLKKFDLPLQNGLGHPILYWIKSAASTTRDIEFNLLYLLKYNISVLFFASLSCFTLTATVGYALLFSRKWTSDYVITRGMPSLKAVTVCLWMKSTDTGNEGVPFSYNVGSSNELLLHDYRNFLVWVGNTGS